MNAMTTRGLSLGAAVAVWTIISHVFNLPLQLWPVIVGLGLFLAAGGGMSGLQQSAAGSAAGVVWAMVYVTVSGALGRQEILDALVLGAVAFGMVLQARVPLLGHTGSTMAGAAVAVGVMGMRTVTLQGGIRVAIMLAIGAGLGYGAELLAGMMKQGRRGRDE